MRARTFYRACEVPAQSTKSCATTGWLSTDQRNPMRTVVDRISDILVIVNPLVRDQPAIAKAAQLALWFGADIELLICDTRNLRQAHTEGELPALSSALLSDNLEALIDEFAQPLRDGGIGVETHIIGGNPLHKAVVSWMRNSPAHLVVKDTHHHSFAKRAFGMNTH